MSGLSNLPNVQPTFSDEKYYSSDFIAELERDIAAIEKKIADKLSQAISDEAPATGKCEFIIEHWNERDVYVCGQEALTFCAECGHEVCLKHATKISMETYCDGCAANLD